MNCQSNPLRNTATRQEVGAVVAARLYAAEVAIDLALVEVASLAAILPDARGQALLSATTGQQVFDGAAASLSALTTARARLGDTHRSLAAVARRLGLDILAVGPLDKPDDRPPVGGGGQPGVQPTDQLA
jgi:hypothetical protein